MQFHLVKRKCYFFFLLWQGLVFLPSGSTNSTLFSCCLRLPTTLCRYSSRRAACSSVSASVNVQAFCFFASSLILAIFSGVMRNSSCFGLFADRWTVSNKPQANKSFLIQQFFKNAGEVWTSSPHLRSKLFLQ